MLIQNWKDYVYLYMMIVEFLENLIHILIFQFVLKGVALVTLVYLATFNLPVQIDVVNSLNIFSEPWGLIYSKPITDRHFATNKILNLVYLRL